MLDTLCDGLGFCLSGGCGSLAKSRGCSVQEDEYSPIMENERRYEKLEKGVKKYGAVEDNSIFSDYKEDEPVSAKGRGNF